MVAPNPDLVFMAVCTILLATLLLFGIAVELARINRLDRKMEMYLRQLRAFVEREEEWRR